eukprot:IDg13803t1
MPPHRPAFAAAPPPFTRARRLPRATRRHALHNPTRTLRASLAERTSVTGGGLAPPSDAFDNYDGLDLNAFENLAASTPGARMVPLWRKLFSDQLTPVVAYRCIVREGDTDVPSFLLESVYTGARVGRYSLVGARPHVEIVAHAHDVTITTHPSDGSAPNIRHEPTDDPWELTRRMTQELIPAVPSSLPGGESLFSGGWVGYGGYDTIRYHEPDKLPFSNAPPADLGALPDLHLGLYRDVIVFDNVTKLVYIVHWADLDEHGGIDAPGAVARAHAAGVSRLDSLSSVISAARPLSAIEPGAVRINTDASTPHRSTSNMTREEFVTSLGRIKEHIVDGDAFQVVFSQRFERWSRADPFSVYRSLRTINPSPYMIY